MDYPIRFTDQLRPQIRALRKKRGLTQGELGHQLGVGQARIAEIERSPGTVSVDQMLKLLSLLGASLVLRDSLPAEPAAEPDRKSIKKPASGTAKGRPQVPSSGTWTQRTLSGGSVLVERNSSGALKAKDLKDLQKLNPKASVAPTSARHYVIRPKKGSW
jgi:HTH-type transcriptional regulator/antitoxin HipB